MPAPTRSEHKEYLSSMLRVASQLHANSAFCLEANTNPLPDVGTADYARLFSRVREYTASAVVMSIAGIEAYINELLSDSECEMSWLMLRSERYPTLDENIRIRWSTLWHRIFCKGRFNALQRSQLALSCADIAELPEDRGSAQELALLIKLRNHLVHSVPRFHKGGPHLPDAEQSKLEQLLRGRFDGCRLAHQSKPFVWDRCLGAGCAVWAAEVSIRFLNDFNRALGCCEERLYPNWGKFNLHEKITSAP